MLFSCFVLWTDPDPSVMLFMISFELDSLLFLLPQILCVNGWDGDYSLHTLAVSMFKSSQLQYF